MYAAQTPRAVTVSLGVLIGFVVACGICVVLNIQRLHAALQLNPASLESTCRELEARRLSESVDLPAVLVPRSVPPAGLDVAHSQDDALARIGHMFPPQPQVDEVRLAPAHAAEMPLRTAAQQAAPHSLTYICTTSTQPAVPLPCAQAWLR